MSYICSSLGFGLGISIFGEPQADTVHTMPLIRRCWETLAFENMSKMASAVAADDFSALHAKGIVHISFDSTGNRIKISGPPTARFELVVCCIKRRITASTVVYTLRGIVRVIFASPRTFSALFTENPELFWVQWQLARSAFRWVTMRLRTRIENGPPLFLRAVVRKRHLLGFICGIAAWPEKCT